MLKVLRQYYSIRNILFVLNDSVYIVFSIFIALFIFGNETDVIKRNHIFLTIFIITIVLQTFIYYLGLYDIKTIISVKEFVARTFKAIIMVSLFLFILFKVFPGLIIRFEIIATGFTLVLVMIGVNRFSYSWILKKGIFNQRIILIGTGDLAEKIANEIQERDDCGYEISYIILNQYPKEFSLDNRGNYFQQKDCFGLYEVAKEKGIKKIVVAIDEKRGNFPSEELLRCRIGGIEVLEGNSFYEMLSGRLVVDQLYPSWLIFSDGFRKSRVNRIFKLIFDVTLALAMLIVTIPLMMLVAILIKIDSKGPVFYSQERVGKNHKMYNIYKFRSMIDDAEKDCGPQCAFENDPRITRIGYYLRRLRIDELPQLWNVLKGEMSFVGPRPERSYFVEEYEKKIPYYRERFSIKPGITGWAQVCYQYSSNAEETLEKVNYDLFYIKNMSILMDLLIVLRTIKIVLFGTGAR